MKKILITIGAGVAALSLSACGATTDWRADLHTLMAETTGQSLCEETLFGGPAEMKSLMAGMLVTPAMGKTVGDLRDSTGALSGLDIPDRYDTSSTAGTEYDDEAERMAEIAKIIPDETPASEVMTVMLDGMYAPCGV